MRLALAGALVLLVSACAETPAIRPAPPRPPPVRPQRPAPPPATRPTPAPTPAKPGNLPPASTPGPASPYERDRPPSPDEIPPDLANIPDAVPQAEPRSAWGNPDSYEALGERYSVLDDPHGFRERGYASWYGKKFHGKRTSSGEPYDMFRMTGAHKTLPIPCYARITNLDNGKSVVVRINDRGPFHSGRIIDLSYAAALKLDMLGHGSTYVDLEVLSPDDPQQTAPAVVPAPVAPPVIASVPPPRVPLTGDPHYLQAGAFRDAANASLFQDRLANLGFRPLTLKSEQRGGMWVYRVLIGPFANTAELERTRLRMNARQLRTIPVVE